MDASSSLVNNTHRMQATIKFQLKQLEQHLSHYIKQSDNFDYCSQEVKELCGQLAYQYQSYAQSIDVNNQFLMNISSIEISVHWWENYLLVRELKEKLKFIQSVEGEVILVMQIASLYEAITIYSPCLSSLKKQDKIHCWLSFTELNLLLTQKHLDQWLVTVVNWYTKYNQSTHSVLPQLNVEKCQQALDFFSTANWINLINALFFLKLHPEQLFNEFIHPEKLISVQFRLDLLHSYIELLHEQLHSRALLCGLKPKVDYLLHGNELPHGILIEIKDEYKMAIQVAIKHFKTTSKSENEVRATMDTMEDLFRSYKFWFNPNRLIDSIMALHSRKVLDYENNTQLIFQTFSTVKCIDLYGYFSNQATNNLLKILRTILTGQPLNWLVLPNDCELNVIRQVLNCLETVMDALRIELKKRNIITQPYSNDSEKGMCMQEVDKGISTAILRALLIYGRDNFPAGDALDSLFRQLE